MSLVRSLALLLFCVALALAPVSADAFELEEALRELHEQYRDGAKPEYRAAQQNGGKTR